MRYNGNIAIFAVCEVLRMIQKILKYVLVLLMTGNLLLAQVAANPVSPQETAHSSARSNTGSYGTEESAAAMLRQKMVERQTTVTVYVQTDKDGIETLCEDIFSKALEHTGNPKEGDYLRWHFANYTAKSSIKTLDGIHCKVELVYELSYYTDAQQEAAVDSKVAEVLQELNVYDGTDYEKICKIYDYICGHVTYDHIHKDNAAHTLKFTAYAALVDGTSVCQGYASLFYRMALELGVDTRVISGFGQNQAHGWNIVKIGSRYYNVDATWDSQRNASGAYEYFLRCNDNFPDHTREAQYDTAQFHAAYPMGTADCTQQPPEDETTNPGEEPGSTEAPTEPTVPQQTQPTPTEGDPWQSPNLPHISLTISEETVKGIAVCILIAIIVMALTGRKKKRRGKKRRRK